MNNHHLTDEDVRQIKAAAIQAAIVSVDPNGVVERLIAAFATLDAAAQPRTTTMRSLGIDCAATSEQSPLGLPTERLELDTPPAPWVSEPTPFVPMPSQPTWVEQPAQAAQTHPLAPIWSKG